MTTSIKQTIKAWSYNRLKTFETCPFRAYLECIAKIRQPERPPTHPAMRGIKIHTEAEDYVQGKGPLTPALKKFKTQFEELRSEYEEENVEIEGDWAFDENWERTGYYDPNCWARMKLDVLRTENETSAIIIDHKTGKKFGNEVPHNQQGQLYAIGTFLRYPELEFLTVEFWYLDLGQTTSKTYTRDQALRYFKSFNDRAITMTSATEFPPKPNRHNCRWCPFKPTELNKCNVGVCE